MHALSGDDKQALRATCRALRSRAILASVTVAEISTVPPHIALSLAQHLHGLCRLRIHAPGCLAELTPYLGSLTRLITVSLSAPSADSGIEHSAVDLSPLSNLTQLRAVALCSIESHLGLDTLTQISELQLDGTRAWSAISSLTALRALSLTHGEDIRTLRDLQQLSRLHYHPKDMHPAVSLVQLVLAGDELTRLSGLRILDACVPGWSVPISVRQLCWLTQLTALSLRFDTAAPSAPSCVNFSVMPLRRLGLVDLCAGFSVCAPSVTCITLGCSPGASLPYPLPGLTDCVSLAHLQLVCAESLAVLSAELLPPQPITVSVSHADSQLLIVQPGAPVQLQLVDSVSFLDEAEVTEW